MLTTDLLYRQFLDVGPASEPHAEAPDAPPAVARTGSARSILLAARHAGAGGAPIGAGTGLRDGVGASLERAGLVELRRAPNDGTAAPVLRVRRAHDRAEVPELVLLAALTPAGEQAAAALLSAAGVVRLCGRHLGLWPATAAVTVLPVLDPDTAVCDACEAQAATFDGGPALAHWLRLVGRAARPRGPVLDPRRGARVTARFGGREATRRVAAEVTLTELAWWAVDELLLEPDHLWELAFPPDGAPGGESALLVARTPGHLPDEWDTRVPMAVVDADTHTAAQTLAYGQRCWLQYDFSDPHWVELRVLDPAS